MALLNLARRAPLATTLLAVTLVGSGLLACLPRMGRNDSHFGRMMLAAFALGLVQVASTVRKRASVIDTAAAAQPRWLLSLWLAAGLYGTFNYYQFDQRMFTEVGDYADATYYYLNSKYFEEIGYDHLYEAMLVADAEGPNRLRKVRRYRDLTNYVDIHSRNHALGRADLVKARFSPARWKAFSSDLAFITKQGIAGGFDYFFIDHGYNPPPPWTFVGGTLASLVPVTHMKWLTSIDIVLVCGLMVLIARSFGLPAMLIAAVFFLCTFSGRWPVLGQSILRFDWLTALVASACALKAGHHGLAGAALAYATCNRIFPGIFALPYLAWALATWVARKRMPPELIRFAVGALVVALIVVGGAWARYGTETFVDARERLALHGSPESFSSHRVGLGHVALYRGEWTRKEINLAGGMDAKRAALWSIYPALKFAGLLCLGAALLYAYRSKQPPHRLLWLSIYPLFCLTNPQINYYNLRLLLILFHVEHLRSPIDRVGLSMLFAVEVATQLVHVLGADRYATTATTSYGLLAYLVAMAVMLALDRSRSTGEKAPA